MRTTGIMSIFRNKIFLTMMIALILLSSLGVQQAFAATRYQCGGGCVGVLIGKDDHEATTSYLALGSHQRVYFQLVNTGIHGMAFGIYNYQGELVSEARYAAPNRDNYDFFETPAGVNYYYLRVVCGGNSQTGCSGDAYMELQ